MLPLRLSSLAGSLLLSLSLLHLLQLATGTGTDSLVPAFQSRRVSKSTASVEPQHQQLLSPVGSTASRGFKGRNGGATTTTLSATLAKGSRKTTATTTTVASAIRQRLEQTVQQVKSRTKELRMEQEQKRVDRKLRRDQQRQERASATVTKPTAKSTGGGTLKQLTEPVNPHNLQMPDCGAAGKVYNGRRCVLMAKMKPKH